MELKDQIRLARERKGMTQQELGTAVSRTEQAVKYWESGTNIPRKATLMRLCKVLDVQLSVTGDMSHDIPTYLSDMSADAVDIARRIDSMPKDLRHAIVKVIHAMLWYKHASDGPTEPFFGQPTERPMQPKLVELHGNKKDDSRNSKQGSDRTRDSDSPDGNDQ